MFDEQFEGRILITTSREVTGNADEDAKIISKILEETLPIHRNNVDEEKRLFKIYFNSSECWDKYKATRPDIDNKITVADAWAISRTINGYCFGEPIKYVSRKTSAGKEGLQDEVEQLSQWLDFSHNQDSTIMATLCSSVCGLGYKLVMPTKKDEFDETGVAFKINSHFISPTTAFVVYSSDIMHTPVIGVIIGKHYNENHEEEGEQYTVWTKYHQFVFINAKNENGYDVVPVKVDDRLSAGYPIFAKRVPLIEVERNAFRKGDWEVATDLLEMKNKLMSNRADDVQQVVDYVMVLINCEFEEEEQKNNALKNRLIELTQKNPINPPKVDILKNPLDQSGVQQLSEYLDGLIEEVVGIPSRAERGGGGHDTGQAVIYRNGFRDLENNAGLIIPKMDKAETEFLTICIAYAHNKKQLTNLRISDIRNKFVRSLSDDPVSQATAYSTFKGAGMNDLDALIISRSGTDPSEVHKNNVEQQNNTKTENSVDK